MVTVRLSALNRKLFRDLWNMKGQAFAIAMVVAAGVSMYVMYQSTFASLSETRRAYYERLKAAQAVVAFCGELIPPAPFRPRYLVGGRRAKLNRWFYDSLASLDSRPPRLIQWESQGGMVNHFRVISIMTFRIKADYGGRSGVAYYTA